MKIRQGDWKLNQSIPTERELMENYRASRNAIRHALKLLEQRGILEAVQGSGRRVIGEMNATTYSLGLLIRGGELGHGQGGRIFNQLVRSTSELGHSLVTFSLNDFQTRRADNEHYLPISSMDGLFVFAQQYLIDDIRRLASQRPVVALNHDASAAEVPSFFVDYGYHAGVAARELLEQGHRRIALLYGSSAFHSWIGGEMRRGFDLAHHFSGHAPDHSLTFRCPLSVEDGAAFYHRLRASHPDVTAVISYGSDPLIGMCEAAAKLGESLTEKMALATVVDLTDVPGVPYPLIHFKCPVEQIAQDALDAMVRRLDGGRDISNSQICHTYRGQLVRHS